VLRWREEAAAAERALGELLPSFRAALQISSLQFVTLQNQGAWGVGFEWVFGWVLCGGVGGGDDVHA
jgi:hypothetical protein